MRKLRPATWAWIGLVVYVTTADALLIAAEMRGWSGYCTMSSAFKAALERPVKRWQLILAWLLVTLHLFPVVLPERYRPYEPVGLTGRALSGAIGRAADRRAVRKGTGSGPTGLA